MNYVPLEIRKARSLRNRTCNIKGVEYRFAEEIHEGGEAFVIALLNASGQTVAYLRFLKARFATKKRIERTGWLIGQKLHEASEVFIAAPSAWVSTLDSGRPHGFKHDFTATYHQAVQGVSWAALKERVQYEGVALPSLKMRKEFARQLIAHLATLEILGMLHGDVSSSNFLVNPVTARAFLIDFDAFVFHGSKTLTSSQLTIADGGVKGTPGYMPYELENTKSMEAAPISDRHARDILLVELLAMRSGDPCDVSPRYWERPELTWKNLEPHAKELRLTHLLRSDFFTLKSEERPSSQDLAIQASCKMPSLVLKEQPKGWHENVVAALNALGGKKKQAGMKTKFGHNPLVAPVRGGAKLWP